MQSNLEKKWIKKKIPGTAKIGRGRTPSPIWLSEVLLLINYVAYGAVRITC